MDGTSAISVRLREYYRGQSKTDFAMILLAVTVVAYVAYKTIGNGH